MVLAGFIHGIIAISTDALSWIGGKFDIPIYITIPIILLILILFYKQIFFIIKSILTKIGVR